MKNIIHEKQTYFSLMEVKKKRNPADASRRRRLEDPTGGKPCPEISSTAELKRSFQYLSTTDLYTAEIKRSLIGRIFGKYLSI
jgi:hypothetical protein